MTAMNLHFAIAITWLPGLSGRFLISNRRVGSAAQDDSTGMPA